MRTNQDRELSSALFGRTRRAVLGLLFTHIDQAFYLRELARRVGAGLGAVDREVSRLAGAGIISRTVQGRQVYYQANSKCPVFTEIKSLMIKTSGLAEVLQAALAPLAGRVRVAFIYGSFARDQQQRASDVDVIVVGGSTFGEVVAALNPAQETLGREINPTVYPVSEFRSKLASQHHFVKTVLKGRKIFLIGDKRELQNLASERLAHIA
ncbi:MAG TPA: nucleotidyltransferase domain-containing protein [Terriglobia bacterium]|nr:nucleotidyltransferase domain-containing protein [Terriglobia bacterium]